MAWALLARKAGQSAGVGRSHSQIELSDERWSCRQQESDRPATNRRAGGLQNRASRANRR